MKTRRMQISETPEIELDETLGPDTKQFKEPSLANLDGVGQFVLEEYEESDLIDKPATLDQLFTQDDINFLQESRMTPGFSIEGINPVEKQVEDIEYKARNIKVNHLLVIRKPIKVTPSMCRAVGCNYDSATANGFPTGWDSVPKGRRHIFIELTKQHTTRYHSGIESHIIKQSQLPKSWLHKQ